jgi:hypothetical protein
VAVVRVDNLAQEVGRKTARIEGEDQLSPGLATLIRLTENLHMTVVDVEVCSEA